MDEPQPTQNLFHTVPPDEATRLIGPAGALPPPEWPAQPWRVPVWRRRGPLIGAGLLVLVVAGLVVGIVLAAPGSPPTPTNTAAAAPATSTAPAAGKAGKRGPKLGPGESLVLGTVASVTDGQLVVTPNKGGNPVTVTTNDTTKFVGGATSITELKPGQRVQVIVKNGVAVAIRARRTQSGG